MTYENDPRQPLPRTTVNQSTNMAWGVGAAVIAILIVIGGIYFYSGSSERTAGTSPPTTQTTPSPAPTPPAKTQ